MKANQAEIFQILSLLKLQKDILTRMLTFFDNLYARLKTVS